MIFCYLNVIEHLLYLGDSGLTSVNEGEYNQYAWNDFSNKMDPTFHSFFYL